MQVSYSTFSITSGIKNEQIWNNSVEYNKSLKQYGQHICENWKQSNTG